MTKLELSEKVETLMKQYNGDDYTHARLWGMASAMLTTEQLETMVRYLEQWITEKAEKENQ